MSVTRLRVVQTDELEPERFAELTALCEAAFGEPFEPVWERVGPGLHVIAEVGGRIVSHAMIVDRPLYLEHEADVAIDAGYVENVATLPAAQGRGHGTQVMREVNRIIGEEYVIGALGTGRHGHYARLGWETWIGPAWVRMADGLRVRSPDDDGSIMILRTPRTPVALDLTAPIAIDWRPGKAW